ncbi:sigma-70 family RNA polymerase sigma factor [Dyadobacter sp. CY261]|uniref:RNA polymerase sigma factor n=1 Tax=Dyadobacter sp. CY261 TaxID=2907203 RepID=UPI001F2E5E33|nr:sigma-70 family RNA polymerase sigma factor [Dyadobacter sp. CY261]MCF0070547.1 sigma-70 family RNA polymerase sigma factor [Dyadobacter sp. CY261]
MTAFGKHTDDAVLWNAFRGGDEHAYTELARRYYRMLFQYGQRFTPNIQLVEDVIQDLLVHLWLHRATINDTPSVKFYLIKAFRHRMLKTIKPFSEETQLTEHCDGLVHDFSSEESWISRENDLVLKRNVQTALGQLSKRQQEVIYLRFFQNLMPEEIAGLLAINAQSVSNIIQRALSNLRGLWQTPPSISVIFCSLIQIFS